MNFSDYQLQRKIASMEDMYGQDEITDFLFHNAIEYLEATGLNQELTKEAGVNLIGSLVETVADDFAAGLQELQKEASYDDVDEDALWEDIGAESQGYLKEAGFDQDDISLNLETVEDAYALGVLSARLKLANEYEV